MVNIIDWKFVWFLFCNFVISLCHVSSTSTVVSEFYNWQVCDYITKNVAFDTHYWENMTRSYWLGLDETSSGIVNEQKYTCVIWRRPHRIITLAGCLHHSYVGRIISCRCPSVITIATRRICYGDLAVCVSVTLMYCAQATESIIMQPSPYCSPAILVSHTKYEPDSWRGFSSFRVSNGSEVGKSLKVRPISQSFTGWFVSNSWQS